MPLTSVLTTLVRHDALRTLAKALAADTPASGALVLSAISPARSATAAALALAVTRPLVVLTARPNGARRLADELCLWLGESRDVLLFPETDALPYDYLPAGTEKLADRIGILRRFAGQGQGTSSPFVVVASARAAMDLLMPPAEFQECTRRFRTGDAIPPTRLADLCLALGYEPSPVVDQPGLFGRRGGIVDVFPPGGEPLRLDFWGDRIETIRGFDPTTQRSTRPMEEALLSPAHEVLPNPRPVGALDLRGLRPQFLGPFERDLRHLAERQAFPALEFYRGHLGTVSLLDYLSDDAVLAVDDPSGVLQGARDFEDQAEQLHADLIDRGEIPIGLARPYAPLEPMLRALQDRRPTVDLRFDPDQPGPPFVHAPRFAGNVEMFLGHLSDRPASASTVVVTQQVERLDELLRERGVSTRVGEPGSQGVTLMHGTLQEGWILADDATELELLTDSEVFGWTKQRRTTSGRRQAAVGTSQSREQFVAELKQGDLVVHEDHGIARYRGLIRSAVGFTPETPVAPQHAPPGSAEFLLLEYAAGDNLYVPISQADRVSRYIGSGDAAPALTRLGTGEWSRAKARVRRSVRDIAQELMDLYARREAVQGHAYPPDTLWQAELEASFPFEETTDQKAAIGEVKRDMESARPMDRLLVGDVGFGKTEVALRAAFKTVQDGRQVAILVPTTVLAQQHFNSFCDRLAPFPVKVEMLSRFRSEKEQRAILKGLAEGSVDICIGTHRLVQRDVQFKSLGLVVIDEEQRFGVAHKERLKELRAEIDVLTLTATPIPRTLHMGLVGVRDMSMLETAPEARLPVRTHVAEYDDGMVREAILREIDRSGQVYFVHNRVQGIESVAARIRKLVPDARVAIGHGQMPEESLEQTMLEFAEGEFDILVCTTIIESGLDIPNANTLIVNNAHRFGLAQLYQLRGRVGRSRARAYAYFLYTRDLALTEVASERLKTIFEATELGAGMRIAMKDLEIRGAGNLLGAEQSGHISAVGFDLYTRLLSEQVAVLRARAGELSPEDAARLLSEGPSASLDLPISAFLPPEYVPDDSVRLRLYQRFSAAESDSDVAALVQELEDRFGKMPEPVQNLVYLTSLRLRAGEAQVEQVAATDREVLVRLDRLPPGLDVRGLERTLHVPIRTGSNQLRFARGEGAGWMGVLYALLERLPRRQASAA
ncbi:MAG: transcription-repair coupling factor [Chloroflexi bacterium]|nr:transcription-repair coupling factor [Chloroflexota bacterium]